MANSMQAVAQARGVPAGGLTSGQSGRPRPADAINVGKPAYDLGGRQLHPQLIQCVAEVGGDVRSGALPDR